MSNIYSFYVFNKQLEFYGTENVVLTSTSSTVKINGNNKTNNFQNTKFLNMRQQSSIL